MAVGSKVFKELDTNAQFAMILIFAKNAKLLFSMSIHS
jgi:hypothetical protein